MGSSTYRYDNKSLNRIVIGFCLGSGNSSSHSLYLVTPNSLFKWVTRHMVCSKSNQTHELVASPRREHRNRNQRFTFPSLLLPVNTEATNSYYIAIPGVAVKNRTHGHPPCSQWLLSTGEPLTRHGENLHAVNIYTTSYSPRLCSSLRGQRYLPSPKKSCATCLKHLRTDFLSFLPSNKRMFVASPLTRS